MDPIIQFSHVTKRFGREVALDDVSFEVPRGVVFALLGASQSVVAVDSRGKDADAACRQFHNPEMGRFRRPQLNYGEFYSPYEWNTPWATYLLNQIRHVSINGVRFSQDESRQVQQMWLALSIRHQELGHWPPSLEGVPLPLGFDPANRMRYLSQGLWGGQAPEPLPVEDLDSQALQLAGNEPCLVLLPHESQIQLPEDLKNARTAQRREQILKELIVIPLVPISKSEFKH